jgi:GAF domain-containing protein
MDRLLNIALEQSLSAVGADAGSLMLVSEETNRLEIVASRGLAREWVERTSQEIGKSIAGWVAQHGESVLVTDAQKDARFRMPFFRDEIASSASVPLKAKGAVIGVLNVSTGKADKTFDERDLELLATVANQMAVAIENARLYARVNRRTEQLDSLLQISKTVTSTLNLDEVLHRLSDEICKVFQLDVCVILLLDELSGRLRFGHGAGLKTRRKYVYYDLAIPLASRVKQTGKRLIMRDIGTSPFLRTDISQAEGIKAAICLPLKNQGKLIGIAAGFARQACFFSKSQRDIARPLGELAGVAIRNARVYSQKYRIATLLQQRMVPSDVPVVEGLDIGHKFLPAREVGGDYFDFILHSSGRLGVVVADVSGSDVEAAEYTTMSKHVLRAYARECGSPAEVLGKTNDVICEATSAEVFVSLFYGVADLERGVLRYANAGCEPPLLYRAADKSVTCLTTDGMLLGIKTGVLFEEREVDLRRGDVLILYTDGLTEASVDGRRLGAQAVMDIIVAKARYTAAQIVERIHDLLHEFVHGRITDDVAIVVIKVR